MLRARPRCREASGGLNGAPPVLSSDQQTARGGECTSANAPASALLPAAAAAAAAVVPACHPASNLLPPLTLLIVQPVSPSTIPRHCAGLCLRALLLRHRAMAVFVPAAAAGGRSSEYKGGWTWLLVAGILTSMLCGWAYGERLHFDELPAETARLCHFGLGRCKALVRSPNRCTLHHQPAVQLPSCRLGPWCYRRSDGHEGTGNGSLDSACIDKNDPVSTK